MLCSNYIMLTQLCYDVILHYVSLYWANITTFHSIMLMFLYYCVYVCRQTCLVCVHKYILTSLFIWADMHEYVGIYICTYVSR